MVFPPAAGRDILNLNQNAGFFVYFTGAFPPPEPGGL
jgi:hypothetical protein